MTTGGRRRRALPPSGCHSEAAADSPSKLPSFPSPLNFSSFQARKYHRVDDEWDAIQAAGEESPRAALADQFSGLQGRGCHGDNLLRTGQQVDQPDPASMERLGLTANRFRSRTAATPCLGPPHTAPHLPPPCPAAMRADSSALSRQQTAGPAYLEFPLFY